MVKISILKCFILIILLQLFFVKDKNSNKYIVIEDKKNLNKLIFKLNKTKYPKP